ncbi:MAG: flagellar hook-basal body complex protein [Bdellovibrionales bacterium]|jgi:flagellar hook protein FlgE
MDRQEKPSSTTMIFYIIKMLAFGTPLADTFMSFIQRLRCFMSLYAAMQVAVGGLTAQSASIGNISDNLANSQTTGFKAIETRFESLVTQSNQFSNDPGGVRATPYYTNSEQGNLVQSSNATALAISGQGFFPVRPAVVGADGTTTFGNTTYFTRSGDFNLDKSGFLVNGGGYYLTGYGVDLNGVVDTSSADPIRLSDLLDNPVGTSAVDYAANLPSSEDVNFVSSPSTIQVYDSLGGAHDMTFTWTKTATSEWSLHMVVPDAVSDGGTPATYTDYDVTVPFIFNSATNAGTIDSLGVASTATTASVGITNGVTLTAAASGVEGNDVDMTIAAGSAANLYTVTITDGTTTETFTDITNVPANALWGNLNTAIGALPSVLVTSAVNGTGNLDPTTLTLPTTYSLTGGTNAEVYTIVDNSAAVENKVEVLFDLNFAGAGAQTVTVDFGTYDTSKGVTQFDDTTVSVTTFDQNGIPRGSFQSLSIDSNGYVALNYDNGRTRTIAQIPVVQFFAQDKLQRVTGGAYEQTLASGSARYSSPGTNGAGTIVGNALEGSNVDIADEFTKLIQAQQVYSANAKTITTTNNMMQEAINIIR